MSTDMNGQIDSLWVKKTDLPKTKWQCGPAPDLADGQVLLEIEKYALTANNITYAAVGDGFGYWNFFPTGDADWGIIPVWGFAKIAASMVIYPWPAIWWLHPAMLPMPVLLTALNIGRVLRLSIINITASAWMPGRWRKNARSINLCSRPAS